MNQESRSWFSRRGCFWTGLWAAGLILVLVWLGKLVHALWRLWRVRCRANERPGAGTVPPWAYRQPDPLIYSQPYLHKLGLAYSWDNPDITLELASNPGVPVDAHSLTPATDYVVIARIWNGSATAPVVDLPVKISYLEFGIGTTRHDIGTGSADLAVKGAAGCPAFAPVPWRTPAEAGHYCLQVELLWGDDAEPGNNLGQHNITVKPLNSPRATFTFPLRNDRATARLFRLDVDSYEIPSLPPCPRDPNQMDEEEVRRERLNRHRRAAWPVPEGWQVVIGPREVPLQPGETVTVTADITAPDGFRGRQAINVHAVDGSEVAGGVTLYAEGSG